MMLIMIGVLRSTSHHHQSHMTRLPRAHQFIVLYFEALQHKHAIDHVSHEWNNNPRQADPAQQESENRVCRRGGRIWSCLAVETRGKRCAAGA